VATALAVLGVVLVAFNQRPAVASVPPVLGELGLGLTAQSLLVTIPVLCFGLGALAGPRVRRALGEEWAIFVIVAVLAAAILVRAIFLGWILFPSTVVIGLAIALLNVLMPSFIKRRFPERPGAMTSAYVASATLGPALAAGLTIPIYSAAGDSVSIALGVWALPAIAALVAWVPQVREARAISAGGVSCGGTGVLDGGPGAEEASGGPGVHIWRVPLAWQVMVYMGIGSLVFYGPLSWLPQIYRSRGFDPETAGYLLLAMSFVGMIGSTVSPLVGGRRRDQRSAVVVSAAVTMVGFLGVLVGPHSVAFLWVVILGIGQGAQFGLALLMIVLRSADGNVAAKVSSMANAGGYMIAAAGPLVMGILHSATGGWWFPIAFLIIANLFGFVMGYGAAHDRVIRG
jgi:CP family cyanate transporter-like MFS transporter